MQRSHLTWVLQFCSDLIKQHSWYIHVITHFIMTIMALKSRYPYLINMPRILNLFLRLTLKRQLASMWKIFSPKTVNFFYETLIHTSIIFLTDWTKWTLEFLSVTHWQIYLFFFRFWFKMYYRLLSFFLLP